MKLPPKDSKSEGSKAPSKGPRKGSKRFPGSKEGFQVKDPVGSKVPSIGVPRSQLRVRSEGSGRGFQVQVRFGKVSNFQVRGSVSGF